MKELFDSLSRSRWLHLDLSPDPSPKREGERRTLTNLYNRRPPGHVRSFGRVHLPPAPVNFTGVLGRRQ